MRIDFIEWSQLWDTSWTVAFTTSKIIYYRNSGEQVCGIYFNEAEGSYVDVIIDWSDLQPYYNGQTLDGYSSNPYIGTIWKYGAKIYDDNGNLIYTGVIFFDSIKIDEYNYRFSCSILSTVSMLIKLNKDRSSEITTGVRTFTDLVNVLWGASISSVFYTPPYIPSPQFTFNGMDIISPYLTNMQLSGYSNDYPEGNVTAGWDFDTDFYLNGVNPQITARFSINYYPVRVPLGSVLWGTEIKLCIFMFLEFRGRSITDNKLFYEHRLKAYTINDNYLTATLLYNSHKTYSGYLSETEVIANNGIESVIPNGDLWLNVAETNTFVGSNFRIQSDGDGTWIYNGVVSLEYITIDEDNNKVSPMKTLGNVLLLKQAAMISTPEGKVVCALKPLQNYPSTYTTISNSIIDYPVRTGVFAKGVVEDLDFSYIQNQEPVIEYARDYYIKTLAKYKTKLTLTYDGIITFELSFGNKIRYNNRDYVVTSIRPDYINKITEIEAYGEV